MRRNRATASFWAVVCCLAGLVPSAALAAGGEEHGLISFDWSLIVQAVNFLLLLFLLTKLLYRPLLAKMSERTQAIAGDEAAVRLLGADLLENVEGGVGAG